MRDASSQAAACGVGGGSARAAAPAASQTRAAASRAAPRRAARVERAGTGIGGRRVYSAPVAYPLPGLA